jgi:hypothetical protein
VAPQSQLQNVAQVVRVKKRQATAPANGAQPGSTPEPRPMPAERDQK